ncbi:hypothetical protein GCM10008090_34050 [Arenicella chitinivorans]|uniref:Uncharacterized protein n=1 Tax=Arenicella chitinivorans TaxID=1329800 RepID=A0A918S2C2_9GAMM|nr:hypothetical protein GCM10008090_34050 [Arenicella chitinivorans]
MPMLGSIINFVGAIGVLFVFMTIYEIFLEDGAFFGLVSFFAIPIPIVGSVLLFKFLIKMIRKESREKRKSI